MFYFLENKRFLTKIFRIIKIKCFKTVHEMWRFQKLPRQYFEILVLCLTQIPLRSYCLHEISVNYERWHMCAQLDSASSSPLRSSHLEDISKGGTIESNYWFADTARSEEKSGYTMGRCNSIVGSDVEGNFDFRKNESLHSYRSWLEICGLETWEICITSQMAHQNNKFPIKNVMDCKFPNV